MTPDKALPPAEQPQEAIHLDDGQAVVTRVLVPVANPATAEALIRLGMSLIEDDGTVIVAYVMVTGSEPRLNALEKIEAIVANLIAEEAPVRLETHNSTSIARGILDLAQEEHADLIVLGARGKHRGKVVIGPVVEAVARTAPCNLIVFRGFQSLAAGEGYRQVIVPLDGSQNSRLAARIGLRLASYVEAPMTALYVQTDTRMRRWQAIGRIEASLEGLTGYEVEDVRKLVVHADDIMTGMLSRCQSDTLLLIGFSEKSSLDNWLFGDVPQRALSDAPGPLFLVKQTVGDTVPEKLTHRIVNALPTLTPTEVIDITHQARDMARANIDFTMLVVLSCLIASYGLLLNSSAVIIGAMLIAPLMQPLMGLGVGLIQGDWRLMRSSASTLLYGVLLALGLAILVGFLAPFASTTPEMLSRGQPSLPDMLVAIFSGMAGAYAMARKDIPAALAGVAIAAALMPPLCTVGIAIAFGNLELATGSFLLFLTNIVSISFAAAMVFLWLGVRLRSNRDGKVSYYRRMVLSMSVLIVMALPLVFSLWQSIDRNTERDIIQQMLEDNIAGQVSTVTIEHQAGEINVSAVVLVAKQPTPEDVAVIRDDMATALDSTIQLELVVHSLVLPPDQ